MQVARPIVISHFGRKRRDESAELHVHRQTVPCHDQRRDIIVPNAWDDKLVSPLMITSYQYNSNDENYITYLTAVHAQ
jgi:hypothetical protein